MALLCPKRVHWSGASIFVNRRHVSDLFGRILSAIAMLVRRVNRYEAKNAKFLRERSSDPLGPESCAVTARDTVKRRQGYRRGGQLSCENLQSGRRRSKYVRKATWTGTIAFVRLAIAAQSDHLDEGG